MNIDGYEVKKSELSDIGIPVKNHLPEELKERLKTEKQWLDEGKSIKEGAECFEMHSSMRSFKTYKYFLENDVESVNEEKELCINCSLRNKRKFCLVMGDRVSSDGHCSEWVGGGNIDGYY